MRPTRTSITLAAILLLPALLAIAPPASAYVAIAPFVLDGDADVVSHAQAMGWPGSGTETDPYVISNYLIDGTNGLYDRPYAIALKDVTLHVLITDCMLIADAAPPVPPPPPPPIPPPPAPPHFATVMLYNTTNATIEHNEFQGYAGRSDGVSVDHQWNNTIDLNHFNDIHIAVWANDTMVLNITSNTMTGGFGFLWMIGSHDTISSGNLAELYQPGGFGFHAFDRPLYNNSYLGNTLVGPPDYGFNLSGTLNDTIFGNRQQNGGDGYLLNEENASIVNNMVLNNTGYGMVGTDSANDVFDANQLMLDSRTSLWMRGYATNVSIHRTLSARTQGIGYHVGTTRGDILFDTGVIDHPAQEGILVDGPSTHVEVHTTSVTSAPIDVRLTGPASKTVRDIHIDTSTFTGDEGFVLQTVRDVRLDNNTVNVANESANTTSSGTNVSILDSSLTSQWGVMMDGATGTLVDNNTMSVTITGVQSLTGAGPTSNVVISNNTILTPTTGIFTRGATTKVLNNTVNATTLGIAMDRGAVGSIANNTVTSAGAATLGRVTASTGPVTVRDNAFTVGVTGILVQSQLVNVIHNTVNATTLGIHVQSSKTVIVDNNTVTSPGAATLVRVTSSAGAVMVSNNTLAYGRTGVNVTTTQATLRANDITSTSDGISFLAGSGNNVTRNLVHGNARGILVIDSGQNKIWDNKFQNAENARIVGGTGNSWFLTPAVVLPVPPPAALPPVGPVVVTGKSTGPNIIGGPNIGGNWWSDYSGSDLNGDGFGETPYKPAVMDMSPPGAPTGAIPNPPAAASTVKNPGDLFPLV